MMARTVGASARNGGHEYERNIAKELSLQLHGYDGDLNHAPIQTTRNVVKSSKGDIGSQLDNGMWVPWIQTDRSFPQGQKWTLECKSVGDKFPGPALLDKWLEQANLNLQVDLQGDGCTAVIIDRKYRPIGQSWVAIPDARGGPDPYTLRTLDAFISKEL